MLALHRRLLALRREEPALHAGSWAAVDAPDPVRRVRPRPRRAPGSGSCSTWASEPVEVPLDGSWRVALSTHLDRADGEADRGPPAARDEGLLLREA